MNSSPSAPSCLMMIFGANGDLTRRKLFPALCNLAKAGLLPEKFAIVGNAREELSDEEFRERMRKALTESREGQECSEIESKLISRTFYFSGDSTQPGTYTKLRERLDRIDAEQGTGGNMLFYLATPPQLFPEIPRNLAKVGLLEQHGPDPAAGPVRWRRCVFEKPFGRDYESARALNADLARVMSEDQIYRIDHYLGKETVQNIMVMRFANGIFEPIWNRRYIKSVQINVAETLGVEERGGYYDTSGALRDMVPNHLFQLVSMIAMEPPISFDADDVRTEKVKVLRAIKPLSKENVLTQVVRGQYDGYRKEPKVDPESATETFAAMRLEIDNWRWASVPFYLRTGKKLARRLTEIVIEFRSAPFELFRSVNAATPDPNLLVIQIQPEERIQLRFEAKVPGPRINMAGVMMDFNYVDAFGRPPQTGYETLLYDCMRGDATLFQRGDQIEAGWKVVQPILDVWRATPPREFPNYAPGSAGPKEAAELLERDGNRWYAGTALGGGNDGQGAAQGTGKAGAAPAPASRPAGKSGSPEQSA